jgi:hypothetical protein
VVCATRYQRTSSTGTLQWASTWVVKLPTAGWIQAMSSQKLEAPFVLNLAQV